MSSLREATPPMALGEVLQGTDSNGNLIRTELQGKIWEFDYPTDAANGAVANKGMSVRAVLVRNTSGITLLGKRLVTFDLTGGENSFGKVDGYAEVLGHLNIAIADSWLPSSGVAANQLFWAIISGPCQVLTPAAGAGFNGDIAQGADLIAATAATSQTSDAGRVSNLSFTAATAGNTSNGYDGYRFVRGFVGVALSAKTTGNTSDSMLINAGIRL